MRVFPHVATASLKYAIALGNYSSLCALGFQFRHELFPSASANDIMHYNPRVITVGN